MGETMRVLIEAILILEAVLVGFILGAVTAFL